MHIPEAFAGAGAVALHAHATQVAGSTQGACHAVAVGAELRTHAHAKGVRKVKIVCMSIGMLQSGTVADAGELLCFK